MIQLYAIKLLDELNFLELKKLFTVFLPDESKKKAESYRFPAGIQRKIIGELMLRAVLCSKYNLKNQDIVFAYGSHEKPFLEDVENIHFNLSHSGEWVVCAFSEKPVGVDVEKIRPVNMDIAKRFFSKNEIDELFLREGNCRLEFFFDLWTLKESYLKFIGAGLTKQLNSFCIKLIEKKAELFEGNKKVNVLLKKFSFDKKYKLAACGTEKEFSEDIRILFANDLLMILQNQT